MKKTRRPGKGGDCIPACGKYQGTNVAFACSTGKAGVVFLCFFSFMVGFFSAVSFL